MPGWWSAVATRSHIWSSGLAHLPAEHLLPSPHHPGLRPGSHLSILCSCEFDSFKILHTNGINGVLTFIFQSLVLTCRQPRGSCMPPLQPASCRLQPPVLPARFFLCLLRCTPTPSSSVRVPPCPVCPPCSGSCPPPALRGAGRSPLTRPEQGLHKHTLLNRGHSLLAESGFLFSVYHE